MVQHNLRSWPNHLGKVRCTQLQVFRPEALAFLVAQALPEQRDDPAFAVNLNQRRLWDSPHLAHRLGLSHREAGADDAAGEAFDKVAKLLGLGYPGGPRVDELAAGGNPAFHDFPRAMPGKFDFSFSGIKTSVLYYLNRMGEDERIRFLEEHLADLCASFQQAIVDVLVRALVAAVDETGVRHVAISGGVSANQGLRNAAGEAADAHGFSLYIPAPRFCGDNAAMVAETGFQKIQAGIRSDLTLTAEPALPLV